MTNYPNQSSYPPAQKPTPYNGQAPTHPIQAGSVPGQVSTPQPYTAPTAQSINTQAASVAPQGYPASVQTPTGAPAAPTYPMAHTQPATPPVSGNYPPMNQGAPENQELTDRDREFEKEDKKLYHKRTRIVKFATNKTYFEVFNFGFKHGRVAVKMSNYKPQYSEILISLKLGEYFELKDLIMTGAIHHRQPDKYGNLHFYNKGTASKYSKDGSVSARQLGIQRANDPSKYVVTFVAKEGPGKQDRNGLIQFIGKPNTTVIYPMTRAMLVEFFESVDLHLQGYLSACYQYQFQNIPYFTKES